MGRAASLVLPVPHGGGAVLRQVPLPDEVWELDRPPVMLDRMSRGLGDFGALLARVAPEGLHGAAFRCEAWTVESRGPAGSKACDDLKREQHAGRLHVHPDRREERAVWAVDRAGITYGAMLLRGDTVARAQVSYPGPAKRITGTVPEALERIVMAVLGVSLA